LIAREKTGGSTKSLHLISTSPEKEPETFDIEIMQPPTRDDWITGIREAVDACTPGSDSEDAGIGSEEELRKRHVQVVKWETSNQTVFSYNFLISICPPFSSTQI
jgi:hypothetical protein